MEKRGARFDPVAGSLEMTVCPLCGGKPAGSRFPHATAWSGRLFRFLGCSSCDTTFVDPLPTAEDFARFYDQATYHEEHYRLHEQGTQETMLPEMMRFLPSGRDLLDFGCGNGAFLKAAIGAGFRCDGVELDPKTREWAATNSGCEVLALADVEALGRRYDVIHLGDVLEHLPDPGATMRNLESLLKQGGRFFLEGPIENNPSLVYLAIRATAATKRRLARAVLNSYPPLHLFRTTAAAQRQFFEQRLGYAVHAYIIREDGWPYWSRNDRWSRPRNPAHSLRMAIGSCARIIARLGRLFGASLGNRFAIVASPTRAGR